MGQQPSSGTAATQLTLPPQCVDQAELEKFDGVSQGKYTIGLGQTKMSFCDDREGTVPTFQKKKSPPLSRLPLATGGSTRSPLTAC